MSGIWLASGEDYSCGTASEFHRTSPSHTDKNRSGTCYDFGKKSICKVRVGKEKTSFYHRADRFQEEGFGLTNNSGSLKKKKMAQATSQVTFASKDVRHYNEQIVWRKRYRCMGQQSIAEALPLR